MSYAYFIQCIPYRCLDDILYNHHYPSSRALSFFPPSYQLRNLQEHTRILLIGICTNLTANPMNPITRNPTATALEISRNSIDQLPSMHRPYSSVIPRLFGFVHLFKKKAPSLKKSLGMSRICLTWSDMANLFRDFAPDRGEQNLQAQCNVSDQIETLQFEAFQGKVYFRRGERKIIKEPRLLCRELQQPSVFPFSR
jgi:hypothetical protein